MALSRISCFIGFSAGENVHTVNAAASSPAITFCSVSQVLSDVDERGAAWLINLSDKKLFSSL